MANIDYAALGNRVMLEDKEGGGDLHIGVEDGDITLEQIGQHVYNTQRDHPAIPDFDLDAVREGGWEEDFANLPTIPGPVEVLQGAADYMGTGDLARGFTSGVTLGASERAAQGISRMNRRLGAPAYQAPSSMTFDIGEFAGSMVPYIRGARLIKEADWLQKYLQKYPRAKAYIEEALLGGGVEGVRGTLDPDGDAVAQAQGGMIGGPLGVGLMRGLKAGREVTTGMLARPEKGPGSLVEKYPLIGPQAEKLASLMGQTKQAMNDEFIKVLDKYGYPHIPAVVRPLDVGVRYVTKKVVRASSALPDLNKVNHEVLAAIERHKGNVVNMLRPAKPTKLGGIVGEGSELFQVRSNTDTGNIIRISFRDQVDAVHGQADQLYNEANKILGKSDVDTKSLIKRLRDMLEEEGFTPQSAVDDPKVNKVQNIIRDLEHLSKETAKDALPDGPITAGNLAEFNVMVASAKEAMEATGKEIEYKPAKFDWVHNKYKALRSEPTGPTSLGDTIQFQARDIIRRELSDAAAKHSEAAASLMQQANTKWAVYKKMRWPKRNSDENPMGKIIYESKGDDLIPKMFDSVTNIRQARQYLDAESYKVARQRHMQNLLFTSKPKTLFANEKPDPETVEAGIDFASFNKTIEDAGGIDGEIWLEMFKGEPEKLAALRELHRTLNRFGPVYEAYRGVAEEAGGSEQGSLWNQIKAVVSETSMGLQLGMMKKMGKNLTRPSDDNIWLGRRWAEKPATTRQDMVRAGVTQLSARLTGEGLK